MRHKQIGHGKQCGIHDASGPREDDDADRVFCQGHQEHADAVEEQSVGVNLDVHENIPRCKPG